MARTGNLLLLDKYESKGYCFLSYGERRGRSTARTRRTTKLLTPAARFQGEGPARRADFAGQDAIIETPRVLSTYRFLLRGIWHVAVMGDPPPEELGLQLARALRSGDPVELLGELVETL
jgi:hypothetical protein